MICDPRRPTKKATFLHVFISIISVNFHLHQAAHHLIDLWVDVDGNFSIRVNVLRNYILVIF